MSQLPGIAGRIEEEIGLDLAVILLKRRGGTQLSIPVRPRGSMLAEIIGLPAAEKLFAALGPGKITLPCGHLRGARARRADAMRMLRDGASLQEVALACDMHTRTVSQYRAKLEAEAGKRQLDLPL